MCGGGHGQHPRWMVAVAADLVPAQICLRRYGRRRLEGAARGGGVMLSACGLGLIHSGPSVPVARKERRGY
jgi:hypothetical protein